MNIMKKYTVEKKSFHTPNVEIIRKHQQRIQKGRLLIVLIFIFNACSRFPLDVCFVCRHTNVGHVLSIQHLRIYTPEGYFPGKMLTKVILYRWCGGKKKMGERV